jgi:hypothetical protein
MVTSHIEAIKVNPSGLTHSPEIPPLWGLRKDYLNVLTDLDNIY